MRATTAAMAVVSLVVLAGCGARAQREALRSCSFSPLGVKTQTAGDSLVLAVDLEIRNSGSGTAILDSFSAIASGGRPLGRLSHGSTKRISAGGTDTTLIHLAVAKQGLLATAMSLTLAPPESLTIEGTAWIPRWFGGFSKHAVRTSLPFGMIAPKLKGIAPTL